MIIRPAAVGGRVRSGDPSCALPEQESLLVQLFVALLVVGFGLLLLRARLERLSTATRAQAALPATALNVRWAVPDNDDGDFVSYLPCANCGLCP